MHRLAYLFAASIAMLAACTSNPAPEDFGDLGNGKEDSFGIVNKELTIEGGATQTVTFSAQIAFRIAITQPATDTAARPLLALALTHPDATTTKSDAATEPALVVDPAEGGGKGDFSLDITNTGDHAAKIVLDVRTLGDFGALPNPNAAEFPDVTWQPPTLATWPATYVIFNNPGCGRACTQDDVTAAQPRSVMIKMLVAAIHEVKDGGIVRVSNFNISSSASVKPVVDALVWAMQERHATVRIVMDQAQNVATSKTTWLSQNGAEVRFLDGITYSNSFGPAVGIMHSKIVAVDDQVVFTGSNNFSSTGFVANEENSVVLRAPENATRIASFLCDIDTMFQIGVPAGQPQLTDDARKDKILALDQCNGTDVWFPPTGFEANGGSITYSRVASAIYGAQRSVSIAPDMLAHPGLVAALISRGKKQKAAGQPFTIKLVLDASEEALGNPAFGDCLEVAAQQYGLDVQVRYWRGTPEIFQLMHHKFMLIDEDSPTRATLFNGSANYSAKALKYSFENVTRYSAKQYRSVVDAFTARFARMFAAGQDKAALAASGVAAPACPLDVSTL